MTDRDIFLRDVPEDARENLAFARWQEKNRIGTHAEGCHIWGIGHYACAMRRIAELDVQLADAQKDAARHTGHCRNEQAAAWYGLDPNATDVHLQLDAFIESCNPRLK